MAGIVTYGAYIPLFRLSRAEIARAWGIAPAPGERAVANYDEDSLTMAVAAARDCLTGIERKNIGGLYFASTTAPYKEKQCATIIAAVLGLVPETVTMDLSGSLRCGSNALKAAIDSVDSGATQNILVCVADTRLGYPSGPNEMNFGDGATAVLIGKKHTIADFKQFYTRYYEIQDIWRSDKDIFVRSAEDRFAMEEGYTNVMSESVSAILKNNKLSTKDIAHVALNSPNMRQLHAVTQKLGFDEKKQVQDILHMSVGDTGTAMSLMSLIATLERARNGEKILMANYGNGCDTFILETTEQIATVKDKRGIAKHLASKSMIDNYNKYLRWRELVPVQPAARPPLEFRQPSPVAQWREVPWELCLTGTKCQHCGLPQYPPQRVCVNCHTKDKFEPYSFRDRPAKVFSFSHDYIMQTVDPPVTVTFVDFEGGGRIMCDMTDRDVAAVKVGMPLEMTFRRLYYVGGIYNYWWKCQPVRC
jgi:hydroxymethylglutaryl-CoA synthase